MNVEKLGVILRRVHFVRWTLALITLNVVIFAFLVLPTQNKVAALQSNHATVRTRILVGQQDVRHLESRLGKLQQAQKDLEAMYSQVLAPKKTGITDIRLELKSLLSDLQMMGDFSYNNTSLPEYKLHVLKLSVSAEGNYRDIRRFISDIERSKYFLILDRVDLTSEPRSEILNLSFSLSTYLVEGEH